MVELGMATPAPPSLPLPPPEVSTLRRAGVARIDHRDPTRPAVVSPKVAQLAWVLDESIPIPGTKRRVGLDGVIGLVPGFGDVAGLVAGCTIVLAGAAADVSIPTLLRMTWNLILEATIGLIPFAGDAFDFVYKGNTRNLALIHRDLADRKSTGRRSALMLAAVGSGVVTVVFATLLASLWVLGRLIGAFF